MSFLKQCWASCTRMVRSWKYGQCKIPGHFYAPGELQVPHTACHTIKWLYTAVLLKKLMFSWCIGIYQHILVQHILLNRKFTHSGIYIVRACMGKHRFTKVLPFTRVWPHTNNSLLEKAVHGTSGSLGIENHPEFRAGHGFGFLLSMCMRPAFYILTFILI